MLSDMEPLAKNPPLGFYPQPERWLPVPGWEGIYDISDHGRVWVRDRVTSSGQLRKGRLRKLPDSASGWRPVINLVDGGRNERVAVHSLVLSAFVGPRPNGFLALHWNDNPADNRLANLRWGTRSDNAADAIRNFGLPDQLMPGRQSRPRKAPFTSVRALPSGRFQARYRPRNGHHHSASFDHRAQAEGLLREVALAQCESEVAKLFEVARSQ